MPVVKKSTATRSTKSTKAASKSSCNASIDKIREEAYLIWASKGFPANTELDNWIEAEKRVCSQR